jgi:hypothetical protein
MASPTPIGKFKKAENFLFVSTNFLLFKIAHHIFNENNFCVVFDEALNKKGGGEKN